ncbi:MAG: helix-turn-helix domain-containing protein [Gammaproteobacteria bacterium]|nr:helix-turn-helix domain-containing protein [Gammaproteobacteria bacterium]
MEKYCQFCPVAKAAEILCEKWVILVLRELMMGSTRFGQLRCGLPRISPSILSRRLKSLEEQGIILRSKKLKANNYEYFLTQSGEELRPIVLGFGAWGHKWAKNKITTEDLDAGFLLWDMRRRLNIDYFNNQRAVINIEFYDQDNRDRYWWIVIDNNEIDLCFEDTGHEPDIVIITTLKTMTNIWLGYEKLTTMIRNGKMKILGSKTHVKNISEWIGRSTFADN